MNDISLTENYYTIAHIVQFTGLTDRTIRNYISSGILVGEKTNGIWKFTPDQVENFICHPSVRPSIIAKKKFQNSSATAYVMLIFTIFNSHLTL